MSNLSLARIMYGTNQQIHSSANSPSAGLSAYRAELSGSKPVYGQTQPDGSTLEGFLHKAWLSIAHKK